MSLTQDQLQRVPELSAAELDALPFGAIRLDKEGKILTYNLAESNLTGRKPDDVVGKSFFTEVAPCTNVREFAGRFHEGVAKGVLNAVFPYRFDFQMDPVDVIVTLFYDASSESCWVFVNRQ